VRVPRVGYAPLAAAGVGVFVLSIVPNLNKGGPYIAPLVPRYAAFPLHLDNYSEYERLISDLKSKLGEKQTVVVYSCGLAISDAMLTALDPSMIPFINYISYSPVLVMFRFDNLRADYALVRSDNGRKFPDALKNGSIPNDMILNGTGIGAAFERLDSYQMSEGQSVALFRRTRPVTRAEASELRAALYAAYGKTPQPRNTMDVSFALRQDALGDTCGDVRPISPNTLFIHPGLSRPTSTSIPVDVAVDGQPSALALSVSAAVLQAWPLSDGVDAAISINGAGIWRGTLAPGQTSRVHIPTGVEAIGIMIDKRGNPDCDHVTAAFEFKKNPAPIGVDDPLS
jgi:hypothetical protein